jgi:hypothetical protein
MREALHLLASRRAPGREGQVLLLRDGFRGRRGEAYSAASRPGARAARSLAGHVARLGRGGENPKFRSRNPKQIQNSKARSPKPGGFRWNPGLGAASNIEPAGFWKSRRFGNTDLEFGICFGLAFTRFAGLAMAIAVGPSPSTERITSPALSVLLRNTGFGFGGRYRPNRHFSGVNGYFTGAFLSADS